MSQLLLLHLLLQAELMLLLVRLLLLGMDELLLTGLLGLTDSGWLRGRMLLQ